MKTPTHAVTIFKPPQQRQNSSSIFFFFRNLSSSFGTSRESGKSFEQFYRRASFSFSRSSDLISRSLLDYEIILNQLNEP